MGKRFVTQYFRSTTRGEEDDRFLDEQQWNSTLKNFVIGCFSFAAYFSTKARMNILLFMPNVNYDLHNSQVNA